jgi:predicted transcriptional regulator
MKIVPVVSCYDRYGQEIRKLFYSSISIKILLAMNGGPVAKTGLCAQTGNAPAALQAKLRRLQEGGLVRRENGLYALTAAGRLLAPKIASLIGRFAGEPAGEGGMPPPEMLAVYGEHMNGIHMVLRSSLLTLMLLLLDGEPVARDRIREAVGCSSPNFRSNIKKLIDAGMVREEGRRFSLTPAGSAIAGGLRDAILTHAVVAEHRVFWEQHSLDHVPAAALDTIGDLIGADLIGDDATNSYLNFELFLRIVAEADCMHGISGWANPTIADAISERVVAGVPVEIVISPELALHLIQKPYGEKVEALAGYPNLKFLVTDLPISVGLTVTDKCISCGLYCLDGVTYDPLHDLYCRRPEAIAWGERLFQHYKRRSIPILEFMQSIRENPPESTPDP